MLLEDLLYKANVNFKRSKGYEIVLDCPFCVGEGQHQTYGRLGLNLESGLFHCFRCHRKSSSLLHTARELCRAYDIEFDLRGFRQIEDKPVEEEPELIPTGLPKEYEYFTHPKDHIEKRALAYLQSRGVTVLQTKKHAIGYAWAGFFAGRILFPVIHDDEVHGCVGRDFTGQAQAKYLNTPGIKLLWGANRKAKIAVVVEGVLDALHVDQALGGPNPQGDSVGVATLGCAITTAQLKQLSQYQRVCLYPDSDRAGVQGIIDLAEACISYGISDVWYVQPKVLDRSDPGSLDHDSVRSQLMAATKWSKSAVWRLRALMAKSGSV